MALTAVQHFFEIPELVEQALLHIDQHDETDHVGSAVSYIKELQRLRRTNPFVNDLVQGSPKLRQKMNLERLPNDDLAYQVTASIVSSQLLQLSNNDNLWGYQLHDFNACQIEDDRTHVILYDIEIASLTPEASTSPPAAAPLIASWSQMLLAPPHMATIVRILNTTSIATTPHEVTFYLPPDATVQNLFSTFDKLSSSSHHHRHQLEAQIQAPSPQPDRRQSLSQKRSREHIDAPSESSNDASWEDSLEVCSPARLIKRKKCFCAHHPGWESCIHLETAELSDSFDGTARSQESMDHCRADGLVIYAV